jgi:Uma2 family endonuclease
MVTRTVLPELSTLITGDELLAMGDTGRCELVEGKIVYMSPTGLDHGRYEGQFYEKMNTVARKLKLGQVATGEVGIYIRRNPDTVRGADVIFISNERLSQQKRKEGFLNIAPEIVVEIMSPDDRWSEVKQKLKEYFSIGVKLVWVADPGDRTVYAYRSLTDVREFTESDTLTGDDILPGFAVLVAELFEE